MAQDVNLKSDLLSVARDIGARLDAESEAGLDLGQLTADAAEALKSHGMLAVFEPGVLGGPDLRFVQALRVLEELSWADGAAGWVTMAISSAIGLFGTLLPDEGVKELWAAKTPPLIAGMPGPRGKAERAEGGYLFEGKHQFASGASLANHFVAGAFVVADGKPVLASDGYPESIAIVLPDADVRRMGNWNVNGMQATASIDYEIGPLFVPDRFVVSTNPWPSHQYRGSDAFRIGANSIGPTIHSAVALGMAQRSLKEIAALARTRKRQDARFSTVAEQPTFKHQLASLDIELRAIRGYYYARANLNEAIVAERGGPLPQPDVRRTNQTMRHVHDVAVRCVDFAYENSGSAGLRRGHPIGRNFLNMHAINQHVVIDQNIMTDAADTVMDDLVSSAGIVDPAVAPPAGPDGVRAPQDNARQR